MLADASRDDRLALGVSIDFLNDCMRLDQIAVTIKVQLVIAFQRGNLGMPGTEVGRNFVPFPLRGDRVEIPVQDANVVPAGRFDFTDLR